MKPLCGFALTSQMRGAVALPMRMLNDLNFEMVLQLNQLENDIWIDSKHRPAKLGYKISLH